MGVKIGAQRRSIGGQINDCSFLSLATSLERGGRDSLDN